jgi:tRNA(Ile)-lysidine synthase
MAEAAGFAPAMAEAAAFAAAMARLGPWDAARRVAVAVSGGPDSLALALLAQGWGDPVALIVDHGLRAESADEAEQARASLAARGMPAQVLRLEGLHPGPALAARARRARYAALAAACRRAGLVDLLLGHHAGDQAETVLMRQRRGSGVAGKAGMAALVETDDVRLVRPLLAVDPARLRALVASAGLHPAEDPGNHDMRNTRARLRREIGTERAGLLAAAAANGAARSAAERAVAAELAARAQLFPEGFAVLAPGPVMPEALAALLRTVAGRRYPVPVPDGLAAAPRPATCGGARLVAAGRRGPGWLVVREQARIDPAIPAAVGSVWDGRYRVASAPEGTEIGALGEDCVALRGRSALPGLVLRSLPALRRNRALSDVPSLNYRRTMGGAVAACFHSAALPAAGAAFLEALP